MKTKGFFIRVSPVYGIDTGLNPAKNVFLYGIKPVYGLMFGLINRVLTEFYRVENPYKGFSLKGCAGCGGKL